MTTTPLISAVQSKDTNTVAQLIIAGVNVNHYDNGKTALHYAIKVKQVAIIDLLIKNGADLGAYDSRNKSALEQIFEKLSQRSVLQIIKSFPSVNKQDNYHGNTALHYAAQRNYCDCAAELIIMGADVEGKNHRGQTPLYLAAMHGSAGIVELLVRHGANVNFAGKNGWTPIFLSVFKGDIEMIELLVSLGADVDHLDANGWTPLFYAIQKADDQVVQLLLKHCRNLGYECVVRYTAIGLARQIRDDRVRELISARVEDRKLSDSITANSGVSSMMLF